MMELEILRLAGYVTFLLTNLQKNITWKTSGVVCKKVIGA
jgi:hypothetical protein